MHAFVPFPRVPHGIKLQLHVMVTGMAAHPIHYCLLFSVSFPNSLMMLSLLLKYTICIFVSKSTSGRAQLLYCTVPRGPIPIAVFVNSTPWNCTVHNPCNHVWWPIIRNIPFADPPLLISCPPRERPNICHVHENVSVSLLLDFPLELNNNKKNNCTWQV